MQRSLFSLMIVAVVLFVSTTQAIPRPEPVNTPRPEDVGLVGDTIHPDGIWELSEDFVFYPKEQYSNGVEIEESEHMPEDKPFVALNRFEPVSVEFLLNGDVALNLLLTQEEAAEFPDRIVISKEEFEKANFEFLEKGGVFDLYAGYSVYQDTKEASRSGVTSKKKRMHYQGYGGCLAYVCKRVGCSGTVGNGKGLVGYVISKKGWKSVSCKSPKSGDVASWSGGPKHRSGHCAIWYGGWCFDQGCFLPGEGYGRMTCARRK